jgi:hypothetical protein
MKVPARFDRQKIVQVLSSIIQQFSEWLNSCSSETLAAKFRPGGLEVEKHWNFETQIFTDSLKYNLKTTCFFANYQVQVPYCK